jgi:hypothetical protein
MPEIQWLSDTECRVGDLRFQSRTAAGNEQTDAERLVILKSMGMLKDLLGRYRAEKVRRVFEFGISNGGSALFWTLALELERMGALDHSEPKAHVQEFIDSNGLSDRLKLHYEASQDDRKRVDAAIRQSFAPGELDLIIDDASHQFMLTRTSFEIAFPYLKPGGLYVVEDWGWAHWRSAPWNGPDRPWKDNPAMSTFIFELLMIVASQPKLISSVQVEPALVFIRKSPHAPVGEPLVVSDAYSLRPGTKLGTL